MPFYDPSSWDLSEIIFANATELVNEYKLAIEANLVKEKLNDITSFGNNLYEGHVDFFPIHMDPTLWSPNERKHYSPAAQAMFNRNKSFCPAARNIIEKFPKIRQWFWNDLEPGGKVTPHYGTNGRLYNKIPDHHRIQYCWDPGVDCKFYIEKEYIKYRNNLCFGFEDGMDLHWVENSGNQWRCVLIIDIYRDACPEVDWTKGHPDAVHYVSQNINAN